MVGLFGGYGIRFAETLALKEEDVSHQMGKFVEKKGKPIVVHSLFSSQRPHALDLLRYYNIPVFDSLEVACHCISALSERGSYLNEYHAKVNFVFNWKAKSRSEGREIIDRARNEGRRYLLEPEAKELFRLHKAPVTDDFIAQTAEEAVEKAKEWGGEIALKIVSPQILHKSDAGGVRLNLRKPKEIHKAFQDIIDKAKRYAPDADIRGVLMSPMVKQGLEIIIGTKVDDQFGPVIMFGIGGIMVEILKDVSFRVLPISPTSAKKMIQEIRSAPILDGVRGQPPLDKKAIRRLLVLCSEITEAYPDIQEMDLNPIIVHENGATIIDVRIILNEV